MAGIAIAVLTGGGSPATVEAPTLVARAVLAADATAPAPWPAAPDASPRAAAGASQPVGGFSALQVAGDDQFWALPDNGYGAKANSASFLLRVYRLRARFKTRDGGPGTIKIEDFVQLRDPDRHVSFPLATGRTEARLLTGGDFDPESLVAGDDGEFWIGDEYGPFILHADRSGKLLEPPISLPYIATRDNPLVPPGFVPNLARSKGLEAMARSHDGDALYPVLEGPVATDPDHSRRWIAEYDLRERRWTPRQWQYRVERPDHLVADLAPIADERFLVLERDTSEGATAEFKKVFAIDLRRSDPKGVLIKHEVLDLLDIRDPDGISLPARPGDIGIGDPFSMPYIGAESLVVLDNDRIATVNDTNFESRGRNPGRLEDSDLVVVQLPSALRPLGSQNDSEVGGVPAQIAATPAPTKPRTNGRSAVVAERAGGASKAPSLWRSEHP